MDKGIEIEVLKMEVNKGFSIRAVASKYGIPFSTLRDALTRDRERDRDRIHRINLAVQDVLGGLSYRKAGIKHNISKSTLFDYVKAFKTKERDGVS